MVSPSLVHGQHRWLVFAALFLGSSGAPGCRTSCDDAVDSTPEVFAGGETDASATSYQSSSWEGPFLKFPPRKVYEFTHHLRTVPVLLVPYVAFRPSGQSAVAAGDLAPITEVNATSFRVTNNTCETFYLRVAAYAGNYSESGDAGDGGSGGGS